MNIFYKSQVNKSERNTSVKSDRRLYQASEDGKLKNELKEITLRAIDRIMRFGNGERR
jgi:hypothetical protein